MGIRSDYLCWYTAGCDNWTAEKGDWTTWGENPQARATTARFRGSTWSWKEESSRRNMRISCLPRETGIKQKPSSMSDNKLGFLWACKNVILTKSTAHSSVLEFVWQIAKANCQRSEELQAIYSKVDNVLMAKTNTINSLTQKLQVFMTRASFVKGSRIRAKLNIDKILPSEFPAL